MLAVGLLAAVAITGSLAGNAGAESSGGIGTGGGATASGQSGSGQSSRAATAGYKRLWKHTSRGERRWAHRTSECESGGNPRAIGGGGVYRGAFQFMKSTWKASPRTPGGDPIAYPYVTQAVVAVYLKRRDGAGHWPVCG